MNSGRESLHGPPWLGALCADWPLVPLRYLVNFLSGGTPDKVNAEFWAGGTIPWVSPKDMKVDRINDSEDHITEAALDGSAAQIVPTGSVLVVVRGMILAHTLPVAVTTGPLTINQDIKALVCGDRVLPEFLVAVLAGQADWLLSLADSSAHGTKKLETEILQQFEVPCPQLAVQRNIVATIRARANGLDELAAAKRHLLDLLVEKRKAIISTAVTRGLDSNVKLRDSGVPWLGEIPAHWELCRAKYLFRQSALPVAAEDEIVTCFRDGQVTLRRNRREEGFTNADLEVGYQGIRQGQLVLHSMDAFAGAIGVSDSDGRCSPEYIICDPLDGGVIVPEYFGPLLRTMALAGFIQASCPAVRERAPRIRFNNFGEMYLPVPPKQEQRAIVEHIARATGKLDAVWAATERTVALLKERRSALIAAAVTGQLDVGTAA